MLRAGRRIAAAGPADGYEERGGHKGCAGYGHAHRIADSAFARSFAALPCVVVFDFILTWGDSQITDPQEASARKGPLHTAALAHGVVLVAALSSCRRRRLRCRRARCRPLLVHQLLDRFQKVGDGEALRRSALAPGSCVS